MIRFQCPSCGKEFKVQDEYAGRSTRCPNCKRALAIPNVQQTEAFAATGGVSGAARDLEGEGTGALTLQPPSLGGHRSVAEVLAGRSLDGGRYIADKEIARGGMGAVVRAVDCDIRREVAIKFMLDDKDPKQKARFIEEAQITGQLEHPNIVPIHELGVDAQKRLFFSMKMVRGRGLDKVLSELATKPEAAEREWSLGRLLNVLVSVCNALSYAHVRGVVHRDLKPANIMIGDFGEVYLMDWGVAKVLNRPEGAASRLSENEDGPAPQGTFSLAPSAGKATSALPPVPGRTTAALPTAAETQEYRPGATPPPLPPLAPPRPPLLDGRDTTRVSTSNSKVVTDRQGDGNLTREGWVLGTPSYMPPEQARGKMQAVDQRSDVYALGAILYEILTLHPPIEIDSSDPYQVLARVIKGEIMPPERRAPERWRQGKIPRELAAVAMKALSNDPADRYQTVAFLRRDIELFQEGRSVSAKDDSRWEMLVKFVKRNKGFSAATGVGVLVLLVVLVWTSLVNYQARLRADEARVQADEARLVADEARERAENNYQSFLKEQKERRELAKKSVPAFLRAAALAMNERKLEDALAQVNVAIDSDPDNPEGQLLRGQLLIGLGKYARAAEPLNAYLRLRPDDEKAKKLVTLAAGAKADDVATLLAFADVFQAQKVFALTEHMTRLAEGLVTSTKERLTLYQKRIDAAWPDAPRLSTGGKGRLSFAFSYYRDKDRIHDLTPLKGIPLTDLDLGNCSKVRSLEALRGMPLQNLNIEACDVDDLSPLRGMPLVSLVASRCGRLANLEPLSESPLEALDVSYSPAPRNFAPLRKLKLKTLNLAVTSANTGDLEIVRGMPLENLVLSHSQVDSIVALRGLRLKHLELTVTKVADLTPLEGMPLISLHLGSLAVDLAPLEGIKTLTQLGVGSAAVGSGLAPLRGLPLTHLTFFHGDVNGKDLEHLKDMPLKELKMHGCNKVSDISHLRGLKLQHLNLRLCSVSDLGPLEGMPLLHLDIGQNPASDLRPLRGMRLQEFGFTPHLIKEGIEAIREMRTLKSIFLDHAPRYGPEEFWRRFDAGEFRGKK